MAVKASAQVSVVDISDAYNVILTSESYTFTGNTSGATSGLSCSTQVVAYCGNEQCGTVTVGTITCSTGISATITNNKTKTPTITFKTTATVTSACQATIPVTVDGVTINKKFSFAVAKTGSTGNGIKAITEHYAVSSSNTATPTEWFDYVMVTNSVERYLWYYETITYTNGTSVDGKKRVIGTYGEKGDDFRWNLVKGTNVASTVGWSGNGWSGSFDTLSKDERTYKLVARSGWYLERYVNLKEYVGQTVTISFYAKNVSEETTATENYSLEVSNATGNNPYFTHAFKTNEPKPKQDVWEYYSYTANSLNSDGQLGIGSACHPEGKDLKSTWLIKDLKIELGSPATDWSPHPDDLVGTDGKGIKSTAITYQAGSSGTTAPTGTWQTTVPATSASSPYLWTRTIITYTDDTTSTSYAVGSTLEGVSVGGRNLLIGSSKYREDTPFTYTATGKDANTIIPGIETAIEPGETYIIQCKTNGPWGKHISDGTGNGATHLFAYLYTKDMHEWSFKYPITLGAANSYKTNTTGLGIWKLKIPNDEELTTMRLRVDIHSNGSTQYSYKYWDFKVEKGNIATDWTPAPEDGIASVDVEYYLSTSATALSGGSWSTAAPAWVNGKYMWSRTVTTDGAGNKTYSPNQNGVCIAGAKGETGAAGGTGADGKGVTSIVEQYYQSTSATALSGGSWSEKYPGWESGKYIWTRSIITYTDKTTTTTTAVCVTGEKGEDGYSPTATVSKTGDTTTITIVDKTGTHTQTVKDGTNGTPGKDGTNGKTTYFHVKYSNDGGKTFTSNSGETVGSYIGTCTNYTEADPTTVGSYVWVKIKGEKGEGLDIKDTRATNESPNWYVKNYPKTTVMELKECQAIGLSNVGTYCNLQTIVLWSDNTVGYPRQTAKIEGTGKEYWRVGTGDTTWSPWIDPYGESLEAAKTATNFMEFTSGTGLQIGDKTNGTWKGFRSRITSTAFEILNEAGTAVASYGRKLIQLGKDTTDAVIELCGGKGKISYQSNVKIGDVIDDYISISSGSLMLNATKGITLKNNSPDSDKGGENFRSYVQFLYHTFALYMSNTVNDIYNCSRVLVERKMIELGVMGGKSKYAGILISANDVTGNYNVSIDGTNVYINNKSFLDRTYPVGSIYMSTNATNPTDLFGGTWVAWGAGRVPVGFNGGDGNFNSSEKTGGSKTINIQHNHGLSNARAAVGRADSSLSTMSYTSGGNPHNVYFDREFSYYGGISGGSKHATDTSLIYGNTNNGGSTAASVLQPYITCYMWKRTA